MVVFSLCHDRRRITVDATLGKAVVPAPQRRSSLRQGLSCGVPEHRRHTPGGRRQHLRTKRRQGDHDDNVAIFLPARPSCLWVFRVDRDLLASMVRIDCARSSAAERRAGAEAPRPLGAASASPSQCCFSCGHGDRPDPTLRRGLSPWEGIAASASSGGRPSSWPRRQFASQYYWC